MKKYINIIFLILVLALITQMVISKEEKKLDAQVVNAPVGVSTFALYDITRAIAADTQKVFMIIPFGADLHSFEPTPKLMMKIQKSPLVLYSGTGLQPWIEDIDFENRAVDMSHYVKLIAMDKDDEHHHDEHDDEEHNEHGAIDHHYWLDIDNMIKMTEIITRELIVLSPKNKDLYTQNRDAYISKLKKLDSDYKNSLSSCKKETIIVNHNAFSYLAKRYGFETLALSGLSPEAQPDAHTMIELIEHVKEHNLSTVFFESFASDKAMKSIANFLMQYLELL